jgi:hypothetical protein
MGFRVAPRPGRGSGGQRLSVRIIRAGMGVLLVLLAVLLMLAGAGLWLVNQHRAADGTFAAHLERIQAPGRAIVVTDVDALLRADAPFARGGQTTLSVSARGPGGLLFLGLGPYDQIEQYLAGVAQTRVSRVRLSRGRLPVDRTDIVGELAPQRDPYEAPFWRATSTGLIRDGKIEDALTWSPAATRGQRLAVVVMNADGSPGVDVDVLVRVRATWLRSTTGGLLALGCAIILLALLVIAWPRRRAPRAVPSTVRGEPESPATVPPSGGRPPLPPVTVRLSWPPSQPSDPEKVDARL